MTLLEYVTSLQDQGVPESEWISKVEEWKKKNQPEQVEVETIKAPEQEQLKLADVAEPKDATAASTNLPEASENLESGNGQLEYQDDYGLQLQPIKGLSDKIGGFGTSEFFKDVVYNMQLDEYETKLNEYNKLKKSQKQGIDLIESGEVGYESRVIIPRGETGFDEFTFSQIKEKIDNKDPGFENVKDVKDYVNKVPGAEIINYTENLDFEGAVGTLPEVVVQTYDPKELNIEIGNKAWETNNEQSINSSLKNYGDSVGKNYFITNKSTREAEKERADGSNAINVSSIQDYRANYLGSQASMQFDDVSIDDVLKDGEQFLNTEEINFLKLSPEEQDKIASEKNYGERLFFGDEIKNLDLDKVSESQIELFQESKKLAETTEKEVLQQRLKDDYFKIVGLAQEIYNWNKQSSGAANDPIYFSKNGGYQGKKGFEWAEDISSLVEEIALNGRLPGYLEELDVRAIDDEDGHPLIKAFNDAVKNYKIVNRAYQLDRDPLTTEKGGFVEEFTSATLKLLGGTPDLTDRERKNTYLNWAQANGFTASKSALDNSLAIQIPGAGLQAPESFGQEIGATAPDLLAWMGDVYLFTRGSGNIVAKTQKWANKLATNSKRFSKIPYALPAFKTANAALGQAVSFTGGNIVSQYRTGEFSLEELPSSAGFGASLAVGHSIYDPFVKYLGTSKIGRLFSPVVNVLTKYAPNTYKRVSRSVGGGFGGATTYQFGTAVTGGLFDEQGNLTISLHTQAAETIKMIIAGTFTKAIPNMRSIGKEFKSDIINAKTSGRLDLQSRQSAKNLGVDEKNITDATTDAVDELNNAFDNKVKDLLKRKREGKITKEEADTEFKKLKEDYRVVDTQITVNAAYELIQAEKSSGNAPKESEFYIVSQKIKNGQKLNARDGEVLSYYGLDGVGMLYKRLGIQKNSVNDSYLQNLILNESLIDAQLNGKSFMLTPYGLQPLNPTEFVAPRGSKARENTREFLLKKQELNEKIYRLKNLDKTNLSESELLENRQAIRDAEQELSQYVKGGKEYNEIQSQLSGASIKAYEKDIAQKDISEGQVIEAKTPEEFQKIYDESGFKAEDVKGKIAFTDKDGNKIINREFALEQRNFTPVTHEIPHSILKDSFKDAQGNVTPEGIKMIDGVLENLTPRQKRVLDEELLSRYEVGLSKEKWYEENITVLAELIKRGEIQFSKSFGEGLAGLVPAFKNFLPNIEVNPNTGKGIFDMLKAQDLGRVTIEKSEGKEKLLPEGELAPAFSLAKKDSDTVNKLFEEKGKDGSFEILELLRPTAVALARRFRNRPNYDEQLLVDEIMTGKRGMLDVINDYAAKLEKGDKVGELSLFLNNSFSTKTGFKRYIEIADRNLGKEFDENVDDLAGLKEAPAVEVTKEAPVEKIAKKPTETTKFEKTRLTPEFLESITIEEGQSQKDAIENKITEVVKESYKDRGPIKKYKDLGKTPKPLAKLYADMFGLKTVDAIIEKARNIPKFDNEALIKIRQFLIDNAASDFARLPKGKDAMGKATGILQTTIGKALYNKEGKLTGTLKNYIDIIKGKNVTINGIEFNKVVDGKKLPLYRDAQHYKAAIKAHIDNRALEILVESAGERAKLGAKFSQAKKQLSSTEASKFMQDAAEKTRIDEKQEGTKPRLNSKKRDYDRDKLLSDSVKAVDGETVIQGYDRVLNKFLKENPQFNNYLKFSLVFGESRSPYGIVDRFAKRVKKEGKQADIRRTAITKNKKVTNSYVEEIYKSEYINKENAKLSLLKDFYLAAEKYLKNNPKDTWVFDGIASAAVNSQNAPLRSLAPALIVEVDFNGNVVMEEKGIEEHSTPQNNIGTIMTNAAKEGRVNEVWPIIEASYMQGWITLGKNSLLDVQFKKSMPDLFWKAVELFKEGKIKVDKGLLSTIRFTEAGINLDNLLYIPKKQTISEYFFGTKGLPQNVQANLIRDYFSGNKTAEQIKDYAKFESKLSETKTKDADINNNLQPNNIKFEGENAKNTEKVINELSNLDKALNTGRTAAFSTPKKIRVFDFDDTLAKSKSMVIVEMLDGSKKKINATEFAEQASILEKQGATFDFTEFSKVVEGKKGPLFSVAQKIAAARGTDDIFILTARPANAAGPIQAFMKANGIDLKLENIVGLGDGTAAAKGRWIAGKAAEGYNDFYFADDAIKNVQAVKNVLSQVDVKSKVQQAKFSKAKNFDKIFNDIIEAKTGIESYKQYSAAKAKTVGANKGKFGFFIPASAEDFTGLLYRTLGKGKVGDAQMAFYKENLLDPYNRAEMAISQAKVAAGRDYKELKRQFKNIPKTLEKETGISKFKYQHAIRTYVWDKQGLEVPGLSRRDQRRLVDFVSNDAELSVFADNLMTIQKGKLYPAPNKNWTAGTITTDVIGGINKINRAEYLREWQENVDIIFSEKNMNKLEAAFGPKYVEALKNSLSAMKTGSNRPLGGDRVSNQILDWVNNSIGAVMFLNTRSAVLQTISSVNFINWGDNNLYAAGKAFGNQKQYWKDFLTLMNSDYLLERRDGLKINVSESEIADAVEGSKNKVNAAISYLLNKGFVFTRYADSFAIASGGATFYRNRIKSLIKEGMSQELAEQQAFEDFRLIAEENQQSSSPMRISQQQRSTIGRMVLAFGNTQMQYARIQKRAIQDLVNRRGDWKSNISKIVYYGAIQNLMFNGLQSALAWSLFDDDEDEKAKGKRTEEKLQRTLNGMIDSQLKGLGIAGAVTSGVKNALMTIAEEAGKKSPEFEAAIEDLENIIPAIGSKTRKLRSAARTVSWNRKEIKEKGFSLDNPAYLAGAQVISSVTNVPVDEAAMKINTMRNILNPVTEAWQKVALTLGWSTWDVNLPYWGLAEEKPVLTETEIKTQKLFELNKADQVKMLLDLGLTKKEIKALKLEDQRVQEIIKLQNKKKDGKNKP